MNLLGTALLAFVFAVVWTGRKTFLVNPFYLWILTQTIMFCGVWDLADFDVAADRAHFITYVVGIIGFVVGGGVCALRTGNRHNHAAQGTTTLIENDPVTRSLTNTIFFCCLLFSFLYIQAVGYNVFLDGIVALIKGSSLEDPTSQRLEAYAGDRYLAPGYANQFKNILLPMLACFYGARVLMLRGRTFGAVTQAAILLGVVVFFLMMTGQRSPLVLAGIGFFSFSARTFQGKQSRQARIKAGLGLLTLYFTATLILGRSGTKNIQSVSDLFALLEDLKHRVFAANQIASTVGFRYIYLQETTWGMEWYQAITGLLPGFKGSTLSNEVFAVLTGGTRGTAPVSVWGSLWYNFGPAGIVVFPLFYGWLCMFTHQKFMSQRPTLLRNAAYSFLYVSLATWVAGAPTYLFNTGTATVLIFLGLRSGSRAYSRRLTRSLSTAPAQ